MDEIRVNRVRAMMKDELSLMINRGLKDPRIPTVTVTDVQLTRDGKQATVYISIMKMGQEGDHPEIMEGCLEGLNSAKGFLKRSLNASMSLRAIPDLLFKEDKGLENTIRVNELLKQLENEKKSV